MPATSKVQDLPEALGWLLEGRTYQWIVDEYARKYNVPTTVSMWAVIRRRHGIPPRIARDKALIPWKVEPEHRHSHAAAMLRAEARRRAGLALSPKIAKSLDAWLTRMKRDRTVILYDRAVGWRYVPRRPGVDLDLIREPKGLMPCTAERPDKISLEAVIVYEDGRTVPFDRELLSGSNGTS